MVATVGASTGRIVPRKDYLAVLLDVEASEPAISDRLSQIFEKLHLRFSTVDSKTKSNPELLKSWQALRPFFDIPTLPGISSSVSFGRSKNDNFAAFENLVRFSDQLIELDRELRGALKTIVNNKRIAESLLPAPDWLLTARVLVSDRQFENQKARFYMSNSEIRALVVESEKALRSSVKVTEKNITSAGLVWEYYRTSEPRFGLHAGWEPRLPGMKGSILRMPNYLLERAYDGQISSGNRNLKLLKILDMLMTPFNRPLIRREILSRLKKEFPPAA